MESSITTITDLNQFLDIVAGQGLINANTANNRKTGLNKLFSALNPEQQNAEYVKDNIQIVKTRFSNKNPEVMGSTVDEYVRRATTVISDYFQWKENKSGWEKSVASKTNREKRSTPAKIKVVDPLSGDSGASDASPPTGVRKLIAPIGADREVEVKFPSDLSKEELRRLGFFLLPYCRDFFEATDSTIQDWMNLPSKKVA